MAELREIEHAAEQYRRSLDHLLDQSSALDKRLRKVKAQYAPLLRRAADQAAADGEALEELVANNPQLFEKPRTRTLHGIKVGWQQNKAGVEIPDQAATIRAIKEALPEKQGELIKTEEKIQKAPLSKLGKALLEKLGVRVKPAQDSVVIKPAESEGVKMASELLASAETAAEEGSEAANQEAA